MIFSEMILGESYSYSPIPSIWQLQANARYLGSVSYDVASKISPVGAQHASALAYLPPGTTNNPAKLRYLVFAVNDTQLAMAEEWINQSTLTRVSNGSRTIVVANASQQDDLRLRSALTAAGFKVSSIS